MPVALPALWLAAVLVAFYLAARIILTPLIVHTLQRVPGIGSRIASGARSVVDAVESALADWIRPHLATLINWIKAATSAAVAIPSALEYYASKMEAALNYLVDTKIPAIVRSITRDLRSALSAVVARVNTLTHDLGALDKRLTHGIEQGLRDLGAELTRRFTQGIDRLRHDVYGNTVPALEKRIADLAREAEADIARVGRDVGTVAHSLTDLARRLDIPLSLLESLIASVGIVAALEAVETLGRCSGKMKVLCQHDPGAWEDFLLGTLAILAFPGLREMALMGASIVEDLSGAVIELAES